MGRASIGESLLSGAEYGNKNIKVGHKTKRCRNGKLCTAFTISLCRVKSAKSDSDFAARQGRVCIVGDGALDVPFGELRILILSQGSVEKHCADNARKHRQTGAGRRISACRNCAAPLHGLRSAKTICGYHRIEWANRNGRPKVAPTVGGVQKTTQKRRTDCTSERRGHYSVTAVSSACCVSGSLKGSFTVMVVPFSSSLSRDISPL